MSVRTAGADYDPAAMRLDPATEKELYVHYRQFFQKAEEQRRWNLWEDIPWDAVLTEPSLPLVEAVLDAYREELFLPDYSQRLLQLQRASRGRVWFLTRWSYEESKHLMALNEWLVKSGAYEDSVMNDLTEGLLEANRWEPPFEDGTAALVESLLWERREVDRYRALLQLTEAENDPALLAVVKQILSDEEMHQEFLSDIVAIIAQRHESAVRDAVRRVAEGQEETDGKTEALLLAQLNLAASAPST